MTPGPVAGEAHSGENEEERGAGEEKEGVGAPVRVSQHKVPPASFTAATDLSRTWLMPPDIGAMTLSALPAFGMSIQLPLVPSPRPLSAGVQGGWGRAGTPRAASLATESMH